MKFLIDRLAFRDALQRVEMAIDRKPTRPVLGGILIEANNDSVVLMASDLDMAVRYRLGQVQVDSPGWAIVPGRELVDIVKDVESETVTLSLTDKGLCQVDAGEDQCSLVTMESSAQGFESPESFPTVPHFEEGEKGLVLSKTDFMLMVGATRFCTSKVKDARFVTEGVLLETDGDKVTMVGTDGRRLSCIRRTAETVPEKNLHSVLMPRVLDQVMRYGQDESGESLEMRFLGNLVGFRIGNLESFGRVLEGEFPSYENVIPKGGKHVVRAHRDSFSQKLRLASHLTSDSAAVVKVSLKTNALEIASEHEGRGRATASFEVDYVGDGILASFNPVFLLDGLKASHSDQIELQMEESSRPVKFVLGDDFEEVVMPLSMTS